MIPELRKQFNSSFNQQKYNTFLNDLESTFGYKIDFRIAETPVFLPEHLKNELIKASNEIISFLQSDEYMKISMSAIPENNTVEAIHELPASGRIPFPEMLALDFAVCRDESGKLIPQLIELQGFPSLYCYQELLNLKYRQHYNIDKDLKNFFSGLDHDSYFQLLWDVLIGDSNPENVILLEIEPDKQKTRIDFSCTEKWLGIKTVCVTEIIKDGRDLYYMRDKRKIKIERIYNRVILDELRKSQNRKVRNAAREIFDFSSPSGRTGAAVWIPHPNWFFRISKYSLPYLSGLSFPRKRGSSLQNYVPPSAFLNDLTQYPSDLENYILKPLYSFAGSGVKFDVTKEDLDNISDKENYILQKKINYEPVIITPDIPARAEIRLLFLFPPLRGGQEGLLVNNIVRLSKGKMMGVDFNKDKTWVGSSIAYCL